MAHLLLGSLGEAYAKWRIFIAWVLLGVATLEISVQAKFAEFVF